VVPIFTKVTGTDADVAPDPPLTGVKIIFPVPLQGVTTKLGTFLVLQAVNLVTGSRTASVPDYVLELRGNGAGVAGAAEPRDRVPQLHHAHGVVARVAHVGRARAHHIEIHLGG
jgi:hypothetical protein